MMDPVDQSSYIHDLVGGNCAFALLVQHQRSDQMHISPSGFVIIRNASVVC